MLAVVNALRCAPTARFRAAFAVDDVSRAARSGNDPMAGVLARARAPLRWSARLSDDRRRMTKGLNDLAGRVANALTRAHPEFAASLQVLDHGDVEFHVKAPAECKAHALVVSTARGEDIWIRFAPPQMFYSVDDEEELVKVVTLLLNEEAVFVHIVDAMGEWAGTTLLSPDRDIDLEPGQRASVVSWSGRLDREYVAETPSPSWIEFHDAELVDVSLVDTGAELSLNAYVHAWSLEANERRGTGWKQFVRITLSDAHVPSIPSVHPVKIADGTIVVGATTHNNVVPLPFRAAESVHLRLQLTSGDVLDFTGTAVDIVPNGSAQYIEDLPPELWPGHSE